MRGTRQHAAGRLLAGGSRPPSVCKTASAAPPEGGHSCSVCAHLHVIPVTVPSLLWNAPPAKLSDTASPLLMQRKATVW